MYVMINGLCPKRGQVYYGWALCRPSNQNCKRCGTRLLITFGRNKGFKVPLPFMGNKDTFDPPETKNYFSEGKDITKFK